MKYFVIIYLAIMLPCAGIAQQQKLKLCSTPAPQKALRYTRFQIEDAQRTINYSYVLNVYVHILRDNDGSNAATTIPQLNIDLQRMANFFKPHNICFMLVGVDYFNSTALNNSMDPTNSSQANILLSLNNRTDAINIYVHRSFSIASGGYTYDIPDNSLSVKQSANFNFEHEMGHALGLYHTFETAYGAECPNGSDCSGDGDLICDTPADFAGSQNAFTSPDTCIYTGTLVTNCDVYPFMDFQAYNPSTNNIMSYWARCYSQFTPLQGLRMRTAIVNEAVINNCLVPVDYLLTPLFSTDMIITGNWYLTAKNDITIATAGPFFVKILGGGYGKIIKAGNSIRLLPGTFIQPDLAPTQLLINRLCD
jgi:Pregnancy-associated plasma protein-A